mgnify:CR=1 FL=1
MNIAMWSGPRNLSTALMYAFAQRSDTTVVDEPLYAHYLTHGAPATAHPGRAAILASQQPDGERVVREVLLGAYDTPVVFSKQMTHHLVNLQESFLQQADHILLIRPPRAIIHSYTKVIEQPGMRDVGIQQQLQLFQKLKEMGRLAAVLDCRELLKNPEAVLKQLCRQLQLPFKPAMLHWPAGPRPEDGVWAKYWYHNVHRSTGFQPYQEKPCPLPPHAEQLAQQCEPYYQTLFQYAIKAS